MHPPPLPSKQNAKALNFAQLQTQLRSLQPSGDRYASTFVDILLNAAGALGASDLHLRPTLDGLDIRMRIDGVLQTVGLYPAGLSTNIVARLKVMAQLLTYRTDIPQDGRIQTPDRKLEYRVSCLPSLYGENTVVRLLRSDSSHQKLTDLGLPEEINVRLTRLLHSTAGALMITGPAGSGKTTSAYAALREIMALSNNGRSIATLEDPVEVALPGVAQAQVNESVGLDLATGLKSLMRQDPEVILVGEMRDPITAGLALGASLTGQFVITTFHSSSAASAISRLSEMGVESYVLRSAVSAVLHQRLVRRLCRCATPITNEADLLGFEVPQAWTPNGCANCGFTGYSGRALVAEMLQVDWPGVGKAVLEKRDNSEIEKRAIEAGMQTRWQCASNLVATGQTSPAEVRRVLGFGVIGGVD